MDASAMLAKAGSNLRARLYWWWHAWRLRNATMVESAGAASVFTSFAAIEGRGLADVLCELMAALSGSAPGLVAVSADDARRRLQSELGTGACAVVLGGDGQAAGGYAWARVDSGPAALASLRHLPALAAVAERDWGAAAVAVGTQPTLVLHDIGLDARYRYGFSPLKQLLKPLFEYGDTRAARRALWWAPRSSPLFGLSLACGARAIGGDDGIAFFVHRDPAAVARILGVLSAGEISSRLARIGPPRSARPRIDALPLHVAARLAADRGARAAGSRPVTEPVPGTFAEYSAAIVKSDYPGIPVQAAANDAGSARVVALAGAARSPSSRRR